MITTILRIMLLLLWPVMVFSAYSKSGIGAVASNLMDPVDLFSDFVNAACFLLGGSFLLASIIRYVEHRRNPLMSPISTVVFLIIAGIILILLPFASLMLDQHWA